MKIGPIFYKGYLFEKSVQFSHTNVDYAVACEHMCAHQAMANTYTDADLLQVMFIIDMPLDFAQKKWFAREHSSNMSLYFLMRFPDVFERIVDITLFCQNQLYYVSKLSYKF